MELRLADHIVRLEYEELDPALASALQARVDRLGYLGEFFKCMGHQPQALRSFMDFTEASKQGLADRLVEVIALSVACRLGNDYERNQHERLSVRLGFGEDWVAMVERLDPVGEEGLGDDERAVQRYVLAAIDKWGKDVDREVGALVTAIGGPAAVATMMVLGRYVTHALIVNSLALAPPVPSVFERKETA